MTGPHRIAARLRRSETLQMQIVDTLLVQTRGKLAFGKARLARLRHGAHVDQQPHPCLTQRGEHIVDGTTLVADGEQVPGHW
jgi:hypothetical protein